MPHPSKAKSTNNGEPFRQFEKAVKQIISVPKEELEKREASYQQERAAKKASRKSKLSALMLLALCCLALQPVLADPEERAQMLKARILQKLVADGWQLIQESQSLLVIERRMTGWGAPLTQALTTGANGTSPMIRWSITVIPNSDHYTQYNYSATVNSQNAFGQTTSIPINNRKNRDYMSRLIVAAAEELPEKYKYIPK